ncbi:hypothetical protein ACQ4PT_006395 [Festuca glaucescens]
MKSFKTETSKAVDLGSSEEESDASEEDDSTTSDSKEECPLTPPAYGYPDDGEWPPFVLIDEEAYFADRHRHRGSRLQTRGHHQETNGGLLILRVIVGHPSSSVLTVNREYFVYDARAAKLDHLPRPGQTDEFNDCTLAIVRKCNLSSRHHHDSNCNYVVAARALMFGGPKTSHLCMYHSDTQTWSNKPVSVTNSYPRKFIPSKTLAIGGDKGTVAWVDLWRSIIFCDVLDEQPELRCLKLPKPIMPKKMVGFGDPSSLRDIAVVGNFIKFVDMHVHIDRSSKTSRPRRWKAATWSIRAGSFSPEDWTMDHRISSTQIPTPPSLLHELKVHAGSKAADLTLSSLHVGLPTLSLQDDDAIVYFVAKIDFSHRRRPAWVLALDMRNMTVKEVHRFSAKGTLGLARIYEASRISAHLKPALGN